MTDEITLQNFRDLRMQYFEPLSHRLGLIAGQVETGQGFARISGHSGTVRVYFEYERGLCAFGVGAASDSAPLCSVEAMAERFPRLRMLSEGSQRLSLIEQCSFIETRWNDLQVMFSPEHLPETRTWRAAAVVAYTKKFTG